MTDKPLKAFIVETGDPEEATIQFATTNVAARRQGANEIGTDFISVTCRRLPWADEFAGKPIPAKAYIENGWFMECANCGQHVSDDMTEDDDGNPQVPVFEGTRAYCGQGCKDALETQISEQNAKFSAFEKRVREGRPDLQYTSFRGAYPYIHMTGEFAFEGAQYGGSVRDEGDGELKWYVAQGDKAAWEFYEQSRAADKAGAP